MNFESLDGLPKCKDCGDEITDTHFGRDYCDDCQRDHEKEHFCDEDE